MLIIFDLDDTLIATSKALTPYKVKKALEILFEGSPHLLRPAYQEFLIYNHFFKSAKKALSYLAKKWGLFEDAACKDLLQPFPDELVIPLLSHVKENLETLSQKHTLALVTAGSHLLQMQKLKKAGIDSSIFSMIGISEDGFKKPFYEQILKKGLFLPENIWVCGDRAISDLYPAKELGFKTVEVKSERCQGDVQEPWVDYVISDLRELRRIIDDNSKPDQSWDDSQD